MDELELAQLDLAVARAEGFEGAIEAHMTNPPSGHVCWRIIDGRADYAGGPYRPTRDPAEWTRLQVKYEISVLANRREGGWLAAYMNPDQEYEYGPTPAIAICKAVIAIAAEKAE